MSTVEIESLASRLRRGEACQEAAGKPCRAIDARAGCLCAAAADEIERLRQQLWLVREDMAHLVQQIDGVLGHEQETLK